MLIVYVAMFGWLGDAIMQIRLNILNYKFVIFLINQNWVSKLSVHGTPSNLPIIIHPVVFINRASIFLSGLYDFWKARLKG